MGIVRIGCPLCFYKISTLKKLWFRRKNVGFLLYYISKRTHSFGEEPAQISSSGDMRGSNEIHTSSESMRVVFRVKPEGFPIRLKFYKRFRNSYLKQAADNGYNSYHKHITSCLLPNKHG